MTKTCYDTNLLLNSGTNQSERALAALGALYAKVDERSLADLILFARNYAAYLNYYDLTNNIAGNWVGFMNSDIAVATASIAALNTSDYYAYINNLYSYIITPTPPAANPAYPVPAKTFDYIFDWVASLSATLNQALANIPSDTDYLSFLQVSIGSKLAAPLQLLAGYRQYLQGILPPGTVVIPSPPDTDPAAPVAPVVHLGGQSFLTITPWTYAIPDPNPLYAIYFDPGASADTICQQIASSPIFTGTINNFLNGVTYIVNQTATTWLEQLLTQYPNHSPHYALYLCFLQLFQTARDHLNDYTRRHLEFYYKKVLRLNNNAGVPDNVHVAFTLQKNTAQHLLPAATQLKAGKDSQNNNLFYALTADIVLNQAVVQDLRSLFLLKNSDASGNPLQTLYASPVANSADGQGGKIIAPDGSWYPFGDLNNPVFTAGTAAIGWAIASPLLYLAEGTRTITLTFDVTYTGTESFSSTITEDLSNSTDAAAFAAAFSIQLTGPKNWVNALDPKFGTGGATFSASSSQVQLTVVLSGNAPAIVPYTSKIHGGSFPQSLPMIRVSLLKGGYPNYALLKFLTVNSIQLSVKVDVVQNLVLQNDDGKIDPSKPFKPWGQFPEEGASFIIGSKEVFQKPLKALSIALGWQGTAPADSVDLNYLSAGAWVPGPTATQITSNLPSPDLTGLVSALPGPMIPEEDFTPDQPYSQTSANGFIDISLNTANYNLTNYLQSVQTAAASNTVTIKQTAASGSTPATTTFQLNAPAATPPQPTAPTAISVSLGYTASATFLDSTTATSALDTTGSNYDPQLDYNTRQHYFYHLEPFGFREMHPWLLPPVSSSVTPSQDDVLNLFPVFNLDNLKGTTSDVGTSTSPDNGGELWISLAGGLAGETHSILFQVAEGSSNPVKDITTVSWFYLSANNWIALPDTVVDYTNDLSQSGLVVIPLPGDETADNTRADAGYYWIKAVVQANTDAVCRIIAIIPNVAKAVFVQTPPVSFTKNIPASTISKLAVADGAIKQVSQPYPSFGGIPVETNSQFDQRVSERLRHKHRAVTAWDYERLVLQYFPAIHKVKCLNHTYLDTSIPAYSELKPGHVLLVTIPDLTYLTGANKYLPFTNKGVLEQIRQFLVPLTSQFAIVHVENPQFEGIQVDFEVTFTAGSDVNFYLGQLNTDIQNYLMPWASGAPDQDINFGGSIEKSMILNFVQSLSYVDHVTCFIMNHYIYEDTGFTMHKPNVDIATATTARSIFVPYYVPGTIPTANIITSPANCTCNGQ